MTDAHVKLRERLSIFLPMLVDMVVELTTLVGIIALDDNGEGIGLLYGTPLLVAIRSIEPRGPA